MSTNAVQYAASATVTGKTLYYLVRNAVSGANYGLYWVYNGSSVGSWTALTSAVWVTPGASSACFALSAVSGTPFFYAAIMSSAPSAGTYVWIDIYQEASAGTISPTADTLLASQLAYYDGTTFNVPAANDLSTIRGQAVTASGAVTINAAVGSTYSPTVSSTGAICTVCNACGVSGSVGNVSGSVGSVSGSVSGNICGCVVGPVCCVVNNVGGSVSSVTGSVGSVTGAVGCVTGSIGGCVNGSIGGCVNGNVLGSVASVTGNVGGSVSGSVLGSVASVTGNISGCVVGGIGGSMCGSVCANVCGATQCVIGNIGGAVASVSGNISGCVVGGVGGSVCGNVCGNVKGSTASVTGAVGSVTSPITLGTTDEANLVKAAQGVTQTQVLIDMPPSLTVSGTVSTLNGTYTRDTTAINLSIPAQPGYNVGIGYVGPSGQWLYIAPIPGTSGWSIQDNQPDNIDLSGPAGLWTPWETQTWTYVTGGTGTVQLTLTPLWSTTVTIQTTNTVIES